MARGFFMGFALVAYAIFFATFLYLIAFVGNLPWVPLTVDRGPEAAVGTAVAINLALIAIFGIQHSVMARQGFKRFWTRVVPQPAERSVYVLLASAVLILLFTQWRPIDGTVWQRHGTAARTGPVGAVRARLADRPDQHLPDQSFRTVRASTGVVQPARPRRRGAAVPPALLLQIGPASALFGLLPRLLGDAAHELWPPAAGGRHVGLYADRDRL